MKGVSVQLFDETGAAYASGTGIAVMWFDSDLPPDLGLIKGQSAIVTTDASGYLSLDLDDVTGLPVGGFGFLVCYKLDVGDHRSSPVFCSKMEVTSMTGVTKLGPISSWVRNPAWLTLPSVTGVQKFAGLHAVFPENSNFVALSAAGAYTVNWGDGSGNINIGSGVTAERNISWADAPDTSDVGIADAQAVTFTDSGDTVNLTAHGWQDGQQVAFSVIVSTTGISTYTTYFIVGRTADTFQVSNTAGGAALPLTTDGTGSVYIPRYRQVVVTVVPNASNVTSFNLHIKHSQAGLQTYSSGWLDIVMSFEQMIDLRFGVQSPGIQTQAIRHSLCQSFSVEASDLRQLRNLFYATYNLKNNGNFVTSAAVASTLGVTFTDAGDLVTAVSHGFRDGDSCVFTSITGTTGIAIDTVYYVVNRTADTFQVAGSYGGAPIVMTTDGSGTAIRGTNFSNMFVSCFSLQSIPLLNTAAGTNFSNMFNSCYSLQSIPLLNTAAGTNFSYMFASCYSLQSIPLLNTAAGTNFSYMFNNCYSLQSIPLLNTAAGTNFSNMFNGCLSLQSIPLLNTAAGTNFSNMFVGCFSLQSIPLLNTAAGTDFSNMFNSCYSLQSIPLLNTAAGTNFSNMFVSCFSLQSIPLLNTAAGTNFSNMFNSCFSLEGGRTAGPTRAISYSNCKLSANELNNIYTGLGTAAGAQTITVTNNYGTTGDTPSIATSKGWTVTG